MICININMQTIELGKGEHVISDIHNDDENWAGFSITLAKCAVGQIYDTDATTDIELGAFFRIITTNPASLDVIISACTRAKAFLNNGE